jgi:mannose-6-phosphate isomerase-like protein (cupin superfamily)
MSYDKTIVKKPWGHEYLAYQNEDVGLWFLYIKKGHQTSMHCHPKKTTGLVVLDGKAEVSFLADSRVIESVGKVMIRRGLFHSTKALSEGGISLFEIETPVEKHDLVRLNDKYGRSAKPYEDSTFESLKDEKCLWIQEPESEKSNVYEFANCKLTIETINDIDVINNKNDNDLIMFLKGGMVRNVDDTSHCVTVPGDVGYADIIKQVSCQLDGLKPDTIIMTIRKNND